MSLPSEFVAIDFEMANSSRASICQIGLSLVCDGEVVSTACEPVALHPDDRLGFAPRNIMVHGLTPDYVIGAQGWPQILDRLISFTDGGQIPLLGHNADVERSAIEQASALWGVEYPQWDYHCTMRAARAVLPGAGYAGKYGLEDLLHHAQIDTSSFRHHDAGEDAGVTAALALQWQTTSPDLDAALWTGMGRLRPRG